MSELGNKKVVKKTVKKTASPAPTAAPKSSDMEKWFMLFLKSRHGSREDRKKALAELLQLEAKLVK
jgi:hypothetical protein